MTQELTHGVHCFLSPPHRTTRGEVGEFVVDVVQLDAQQMVASRISCSYTSGLMCVWFSWVMVTPLDLIMYPLLVAHVENQAVALGCKCDEQHTVPRF
jgi:hypothetical protein